MKSLRTSALATAALFVAAALLARIRFVRTPPRLKTDFAQPLVVVTNWHAFGIAPFAFLFAAILIGTFVYVWSLNRAPSAAAPSRRAYVALAGLTSLALACAWLSPLLYSSDVYAYAAYGAMAALHIDPYAHTRLAIHTPLFDAAIWQWSNPLPVCVYGPAFVGLARAIVTSLSPVGTLAILIAFRLLACAALVASAVLAFVAYPGTPLRRLTAAATIGLNPAALWCAAEGHNDALVLAIVLAGFSLYRRGALGLGAAVAAFSGAFKLSGSLAALPFLFAPLRARAGVAIGLAAGLIVSFPLFEGAMRRLAPEGYFLPQASFQAVIWPAVAFFEPNNHRAAVVTITIATLAAAVLAGVAVAELRNGELKGWGYGALAVWVLIPNPYPWYGLWLAAVAAVVPGTRIAAVLLWLTCSSILRYVPDAIGVPGAAEGFVLGLAASLPYIALVPWKTKGASRASAQRVADI
jgi:hypothetical protein